MRNSKTLLDIELLWAIPLAFLSWIFFKTVRFLIRTLVNINANFNKKFKFKKKTTKKSYSKSLHFKHKNLTINNLHIFKFLIV
jgi:hypothetical protein